MANIPSDLMVKVLDRGPTRSTIPVGEDGAIVRVKRANVVIPASAGAGVLIPLFRVSAFDRIVSLWFANTADLGMTDVDISIFAGTANGQVSVGNWNQADQTQITGGDGIILNAWDLSGASAGAVSLYGVGTGAGFPAIQTKELWEMCGVSSRPMPGTVYDIVERPNTDPAGCTQSWILVYTSDN